MSWLELSRRPEPEVMDDAGEVDAYSSAAAQDYLDALDNTLVDQALSLGITKGKALDAGTGPGSIPVKMARRCPGLEVIGIDRSPEMIETARRLARQQALHDHVRFCMADANELCFPSATFDLVMSNSVLHHLSRPVAALDEMARVTKPQGMVLIRDLRRPSRVAFGAHVAWYGRHYSGKMKALYESSARAAYTPQELKEMIRSSALASGHIFVYHRTHLGVLLRNEPGRRES
ncbi:MAG TPA: class I SAM-dependent methyltransferase [Terriglobia bacterium]|nr:class I SAM-dependent methyltransferase [Terriglobia bacterium]